MRLTILARIFVLLCYLPSSHLLPTAHVLTVQNTTERRDEAPSPPVFAAGAGMVPVRHHDCTASLGNGSRNRRRHLWRNDWLGVHPDLGRLLLGRGVVRPIVEVLRRGLVSGMESCLARDDTNSFEVSLSLETATRHHHLWRLRWALVVPLLTAHAAEPTNTPAPTQP